MNVRLPCVAVVDDEESVRRALQRLLSSAGMNVKTFASGEEFLQFVESNVPDCVVLDLHMPRLNGFDVQSRLAETNADLPVVIITGQDTDFARERALAGGARAYFRKPVDGEVLLDVIAEVVAETPAERNRERDDDNDKRRR